MPDYTIPLSRQSTPQSIPGTGISFIAPGLLGTLSVDKKPAPGAGQLTVRSSLRDSSEIGPSDTVDQAIQEIGVLDAYDLETEAPTPEVARPEGVRAGTGALEDDEVAVDYEPKPDEYSSVIYRDEDGAISIHFPEHPATPAAAAEAPAGTARATGGAVHHYRIPLRRAAGPATPAAGEAQTRFGIVMIGKKLVKLVVGKILKKAAGPVVGAAEYGAAWIWEKQARAFEGFHGGTNAAILLADDPVALQNTAWAALQRDGMKTLLFIHGTTSTTSGAFGALTSFPGVSKSLYDSYAGRVIGFNHHTLTKSVAENVADFYSWLPQGRSFTFDIVCHSRGGLVARALKELSASEISQLTGKPFSPVARVTIEKIVFVGTPNIGTQLADPNDIPHALDLLANVASLIPGAGLTLAGVFSCAAFAAESGFKALPGLRNMNPGDSFLKVLNQPASSSLSDYYAIQSNFSLSGIANQVLLRAAKYLFKDNLNDLIVPTLGVSEIDQSTLPSADVKYYGAPPLQDDVAHTRYFQRAETWSYILSVLK